LQALLVDFDADGADIESDGVVEITDRAGRSCYAIVGEYPVLPLADLEGTETLAALEAGGLVGPSFLESQHNLHRRYVIYDHDADALLGTRAYRNRPEAVEDAAEFNDVIVLPLFIEEIIAS
jgi:hypothetical protein